MERERWKSRLTFIFAAVGSAVGLGNIWRFPFLAYKYGGGAFLLPYLIALLVLGIPLLILEFALGQRIQRAAVDTFASIRRRFSGVAWWALFSGFIVISYYAVVMAWAVIYFFSSFGIKWAADSKSYFFTNVLGITEGINIVGTINWSLLLALFAVWVMIYFCIFKGVKSVGKVVMVTMPLPVMLLLVLLGRGLTLPGALEGLSFFLTPNFAALLDTEVWIAAFSQIFFTLTLGFGVMVAYASFNKPTSNVGGNALWTAIINSSISLISGFVVFTTLGFMALKQSVAVPEVVASGPSLAFVVFPQALSLMPFATFFSLIFFIVLLSLGIDSAFSIVEAINASLNDKFGKIKREKISFILCTIGFVAGIIYTTGAGLYFLDIVDHFVTNFSIVLVGLLQCVMVGWFYGAKRLRNYVNSVSTIHIGRWWDVVIKWVIPIILTFLVIMQFIKEMKTPYEGYPTWALLVGWFFVVVPLIIAFLIPQKKVSLN